MAKTAYDDLSELCLECAASVNSERVQLGIRPDDPDAARLWSQHVNRLRNQADSLIAMASDLNATAILSDLAELEDELGVIKSATAIAKEQIAEIKEISKKLTKFAQVLDVGLALLAIPVAFKTGGISAAAAAAKVAAKAAKKLVDGDADKDKDDKD